jgi:2-polyprenyl-3-methyl-5-hydroxy-6-metoxy-1,4-benzoquinol methylase
MTCSQCQGIERAFDRRRARKDLQAYRRRGPNRSTGVLLDALKAAGVEHKSLLDVGGGVGVLQHELVAAGVRQVTSVEASRAYLDAAREEAQGRGYAPRASYRCGDFVDMAPEIAPADVVTLDRVICCYHDVEGLVRPSAERALKLYGLVFPPDTWWMKLYTLLANGYFRLRRNPFRLFVHDSAAVDALIRGVGFRRRFGQRVGGWLVWVYER